MLSIWERVGRPMHQDMARDDTYSKYLYTSYTDYRHKLVLANGKTLRDSDAIPENKGDIRFPNGQQSHGHRDIG